MIDRPTPRALEAALRITTRHFTQEMAAPQLQAPDWSPLEWCAAMATAATNGVTPLLASALRWTGPPAWQGFVADQQQQAVLRDRRIGRLLAEIDAAAGAAGVCFVGLKGAALRALGLYGCGERPMADIDLLVRPQQLAAALLLIEGLGLVRQPEHWRHVSFGPADTVPVDALGEHADNPVYVEVHTEVGERLVIDPVSITASLAPQLLRPGVNPYRSPAALMDHLLLHAAGNASRRSLRLIQLVDIQRLAAGWSAADWGWLLDPPDRRQPAWWAIVPLRVAERQLGLPLPAGLLEQLERHAPPALRRFARHAAMEELSNATARLEPLRGIECCATRAGALRFAVSRLGLMRDRDALQQHAGLQVGPAQSSPLAFARRAWRLLRWAGSRPLRPHPVRAFDLAARYAARMTGP